MRIGVLSMAHSGIPPARMGSVSYVVDQITRRLSPRFAPVIVSGSGGRAPDNEASHVTYKPLPQFPGLLSKRFNRFLDRFAQSECHPFHRRNYCRDYARKGAQIFAAHQCDVVLVTVFPQWLQAVRAALPNAKVLLWCHDAGFANTNTYCDDIATYADGVVSCSRYAAERHKDRTPGLAHYVLHNGVDLAIFNPANSENRPRRILCYAGRITPEKGVHRLVDAFRVIADRDRAIEFHLCGNVSSLDARLLRETGRSVELSELVGCDYRQELMRRVGDHQNRLQFRGILGRRELADVFRQSIVVAHAPHVEEAFGMPLLEASACGAPIVATRSGGIPEFVQNGITGTVVEPGDDAALIDAISSYLKFPDRAKEIGRTGALHAQSFSWQRATRRFVEILEKVSTKGESTSARTAG